MSVKLFVWNNPYHVPYGGSCVFALGNTVEEARAAAAHAGHWPYAFGAPGEEIGPMAAFDNEPDLVLESGAVCYEWSE